MQRAPKKSGAPQLGRSRGGWVSKIHAVCDGLGNPVKFLLTAGRVNDITQAEPLLEGLKAEQVIADKGDDDDKVIDSIEQSGAEAAIPPKKNRKVPRACDPHLYKQTNQIERQFGKLKQFRRIATRTEKTSRNDMAFLHLAASMILLA